MGVITIKQAKKGIERWKQPIKIGKYMFYHLNHGNHSKLFFFQSHECQGIQTKNSFDKILSLSFNLGPLNVNTCYIRRNQFCKGLSKGFI